MQENKCGRVGQGIKNAVQSHIKKDMWSLYTHHSDRKEGTLGNSRLQILTLYK